MEKIVAYDVDDGLVYHLDRSSATSGKPDSCFISDLECKCSDYEDEEVMFSSELSERVE